MDHTIKRVRSSSMISAAIAAIHEAAECAREAHALQVCSQLRDLTEELVHLHREILQLPAEKTPAACEFERAGQLDGQDDLPF